MKKELGSINPRSKPRRQTIRKTPTGVLHLDLTVHSIIEEEFAFLIFKKLWCGVFFQPIPSQVFFILSSILPSFFAFCNSDFWDFNSGEDKHYVFLKGNYKVGRKGLLSVCI